MDTIQIKNIKLSIHGMYKYNFIQILSLLKKQKILCMIQKMFRGEPINNTEKRSVLHVALRCNKNNNTTFIQDEYNDENFYCYPNPFQNQIHITSKNPYLITDVLGKLIYFGEDPIVSTSSWKEGVYFIHLKKNRNIVTKLIKVR